MDNVATSSSKHRKSNALIAPAAIAVVIGLGGFFGGVQFQKSKTSVSANPNSNGQYSINGGSQGMGGPGGNGRMGTLGEVTSVSPTNITVENSRTSSSKTYTINDSTRVSDGQSTASISDIQNGDTVMITASSSDGSTATRIVLNPSMGGGPGVNNDGSTDFQTN